ncbi:hypothetical protein DFH07DRAFT_510489 [Mycena maculata]|uniref:F-box domain-containing protein n=1 Tax=Mycena maculata TaxID=230809 RepID=A0AAD7IZ67_9AGAR|nr:hypothetical protein DFH07DRAFT_510489 [Mycena maculata]
MSSSSTSTSSAGTSMGTLDPAILTHILVLLAPKKYAPHKRLAPLLRVNWHLHALPRLYSAISLKGQWVARPLRRTLEANSTLAALVQELVLDTELSAQAPPETADHRRIVAACPNIKHLTVLGYAEAEAEKYREAIAGKAQLETLNVSEGGGLCTFADLLGMMRGWPMLEKLILKDALLPATSDSDPESNSASEAEETAVSCPALKMVKITQKP